MSFQMPGLEEAEMIPGRIGLIDADVIAYWASAGCDEMLQPAALHKAQGRIDQISQQIQTEELRLYLTGKDNFREDVATYQQYKGNRYDKDGNRIKPQPRWLHAVRDWLLAEKGAILCHGEEADDALAKAQYKCNAAKGWHSIISSIDKDLRIVPGLHHDMTSGFISEVTVLGDLILDVKKKVRGSGLMFFYAQLLMGDSADWIPGLPSITEEIKERWPKVRRGGCGPMAAYNILHDAESEQELFNRVLFCYSTYWNGDRWYKNWRGGKKIYPTPAAMLTEQGQLLWMRKVDDEMWFIKDNLISNYEVT